MRNQLFSMTLGALACLLLTLPVAAQEKGSGFEAIFGGLFEAIAAWFEADEGAEPAVGSAELEAVIITGGLQNSAKPTTDVPAVSINGQPGSPPQSEAGPLTIPGG